MLRRTYRFFTHQQPQPQQQILLQQKQQQQQQQLFSTGFKMNPALASAVLSALKQRSRSFKSNVWFTKRELHKSPVAQLVPGEEPLLVAVPPEAYMKVPVLTLYNAEQTSAGASFVPSGDVKTNNITCSNKKFRDLEGAEQAVGAVDDATVPDGAVFVSAQPQIFGKLIKKNSTSDSDSATTSQRLLSEQLWPTLESVARQHSWTSNEWWTRNSLFAAGLVPAATTDNKIKTAKPIVVRIFNPKIGGAGYVSLWNRAQLVSNKTGQPLKNTAPTPVGNNHNSDNNNNNNKSIEKMQHDQLRAHIDAVAAEIEHYNYDDDDDDSPLLATNNNKMASIDNDDDERIDSSGLELDDVEPELKLIHLNNNNSVVNKNGSEQEHGLVAKIAKERDLSPSRVVDRDGCLFPPTDEGDAVLLRLRAEILEGEGEGEAVLKQ